MPVSQMLLIIESLMHRPPSPTERAIASEIAAVVHEPAAFGDVLTDELVMLETAFAESTFRNVDGDRGESRGYWQLQRVARGLSVHDQAEIAYARLRESARRCGEAAPLAAYVSGRCSAGRRVSAWRMAQVASWRRQVGAGGVVEAQR